MRMMRQLPEHPDDTQIAKLPKWAQAYITRLQRYAASADRAACIAETEHEGSPYAIQTANTDCFYLPPTSNIMVTPPKYSTQSGMGYRIRLGTDSLKDVLEVYGNFRRPLFVEPQASNHIRLHSE